MRPDEIEEFLEEENGESLGKIYSAVAISFDKEAMSAVIQAVAIRKMQKLDKAASKLTKVGIWIAAVGVFLALVQVVIAVIKK